MAIYLPDREKVPLDVPREFDVSVVAKAARDRLSAVDALLSNVVFLCCRPPGSGRHGQIIWPFDPSVIIVPRGLLRFHLFKWDSRPRRSCLAKKDDFFVFSKPCKTSAGECAQCHAKRARIYWRCPLNAAHKFCRECVTLELTTDFYRHCPVCAKDNPITESEIQDSCSASKYVFVIFANYDLDLRGVLATLLNHGTSLESLLPPGELSRLREKWLVDRAQAPAVALPPPPPPLPPAGPNIQDLIDLTCDALSEEQALVLLRDNDDDLDAAADAFFGEVGANDVDAAANAFFGEDGADDVEEVPPPPKRKRAEAQPPAPAPAPKRGNIQCLICFDAKDDSEWYVAPCGHMLCGGCKNRMLHIGRCHVCRAPYGTAGLKKIFVNFDVV